MTTRTQVGISALAGVLVLVLVLVLAPASLALAQKPTAAPASLTLALAPQLAAPPAPSPRPAPATALPAAARTPTLAAAGTSARAAGGPRAERGRFRLAIEGGVGLWEHEDAVQQVSVLVPVAQLNAFFGWTVTNGEPRADGRRALGVDVGFALRLDADDGGFVLRQELAMQVAGPAVFAIAALGVGTLAAFEGDAEPAFAVSLDATSGYRLAGPFYLGITFGLDVWTQSGVAFRRTGVVAGFATD